MRLLEPLEELEKKEEYLRQQVNTLPDEQRKAYFKELKLRLKDPDTYAALNWFFLGGVHHFYLGKYPLFIAELVLFVLGVTGLFLGHMSAGLIILLLVLYELPHLFFSQKIARQHNYEVSCEIYNEVRR
ncbi:TM2 domain-containing protein [Vibrio hyugaensis]|uniref:TM2 domain-containing protein n=1 Tax=Vibrio hyugaensis TaxID=1534743 RepID=A0ABQ5Y4B8_9VIBR|nr:TM2 domain-containing protein [Vibrio hyugaensis]GLR05412.1 hypothetical protein GCM10007906_30000 [Vibrio hyugaensis]